MDHASDVGVWITQCERIRTIRMQRHLAVAFVAGLACAFITPIANTLFGFALLSILVFVVLNSLARAIDAHLGYMWGWLYPEPKWPPTRFDRIIDRTIHRLAATQADDPPVRVRPLDPA